MTTITLIYTAEHSALGERIRGDLQANGMTVADSVHPGRESLLLVVLSPHALQEPRINNAIVQALDQHQHVIPVQAAPVELPRLIDNLQVLDFSGGYDPEALLGRIGQLTEPGAASPLTALTPSAQAANRRLALIFAGLVALIFLIGLVAIGSGVIRAPEDEFASVETQIYLTRNYYIDDALPRSTEDAAQFAATIENIPTRARAQLIETATAISAGVEASFVPRSTEDATQFAVTLRAVSTVVRDRLSGAATEAAGTATFITPTVTQPATPTAAGE